ncbi:endogenous retrovirus group K member 6 Pol -like, partial [Paramuricea clavata]
TVVSDNGPQYSSHQYKTFAKDWGFQHDTSSPRYPKSNGFVESATQTVKKTIKKALQSGDDPCLALLALRSTPGTVNSPSPAFKLMNRHLRTPLPSVKTEKISPTLLGSQKVKECHVQHSKNLRPRKEGQSVRIRDGKTWHVKGKVMERV